MTVGQKRRSKRRRAGVGKMMKSTRKPKGFWPKSVVVAFLHEQLCQTKKTPPWHA